MTFEKWEETAVSEYTCGWGQRNECTRDIKTTTRMPVI